jgi:2'-5' RNA ligase
MDYAILLHFDRDSEARIFDVWKEAVKCGGDSYLLDSGLRPHITLAIFEDTDIQSFCSKLEIFSNQIKKFNLKLGSIGTFASSQGVLYLSPVMTDELAELHKEFYKFFEGDLEGINSYYMPNNWVPHCSISINNTIETFIPILKRTVEIFEQIDIQIREISIIESEPAIRYIKSYEIE